MHIQPVNYPNRNYQFFKQKSDSQKHAFPAFKAWAVDGSEILHMNNTELKNLAEFFHKSSEDVLTQISLFRSNLGFKKTEESMKAYEKLKKEVDKIISERNSLLHDNSSYAINRLKELDNKASLCWEKYYYEPASYDIDDPVDLANSHWP